ncbi:MAG: hypothetical protein AVDCRST_MAG31-1399, partial [uncultured Sphingomonas sp.]
GIADAPVPGRAADGQAALRPGGRPGAPAALVPRGRGARHGGGPLRHAFHPARAGRPAPGVGRRGGAVRQRQPGRMLHRRHGRRAPADGHGRSRHVQEGRQPGRRARWPGRRLAPRGRGRGELAGGDRAQRLPRGPRVRRGPGLCGTAAAPVLGGAGGADGRSAGERDAPM